MRTSALPGFDEAKAEIARGFAARVTEGHAPASCFAVFDRSGIVFDGGYGNRTPGEAAPDRQTRFRIASCTKSFTSAALLLLRDAGQLVLDDPVTRFVPTLRARLPLAAPTAPSLRMLMTMQGGLPTDDPWADRQESLSHDAFMDLLGRGVRFATLPGTRFEYSNLGYALLGQVIEQVSGQRYTDFVTEHVLRPLDLVATTFDVATVPPGELAGGYRLTDGNWKSLSPTGAGAFSSIGGLVSNTADLARWACWLCAAFLPGVSATGPLSAASRREMQAIHCAIPPEPGDGYRMKGYGFGLMVESLGDGGLIVHHSGGYPGYSSHMRWHPDSGLGVVAFENASYSGAWDPAKAALQRLLGLCPAHPPAAAPAEVEKLAASVARLIARWDDAIADTICLENVALDRPYPERAAELGRLHDAAGAPLQESPGLTPADAGMFGRFEVRQRCDHGTIVATVWLGPPEPPRIQSLTFGLEPEPRA